MVTAGPRVTNAMTGIANAHVARAPVLVLSGTPPRRQENRGALQDMSHIDFVRPLTRYARTVRQSELVLQELDEAVSRAFGQGGEPGPVYLDFPVDTLRDEVPRALLLHEQLAPKPRDRVLPDPAAVQRAVEVLWSAKRPLVVSGRGARGAGAALIRFLERLGALYLDTGESRGLVPDEHASVVAAMRGSVISDAKVVGTRLQFADHAAMARAFGLHGERVEKVEDLGPAIRRALDHRPALLDVLVTPTAVSSDAKSGLAWVPDLQALEAWDDAERAWRAR